MYRPRHFNNPKVSECKRLFNFHEAACIFYFRTILTSSEVSMVLPLAVSLATKFWVYVTSFAFFWPVIYSPVAKLFFVVYTTFMWYFFYKTYKTDPGFIASPEDVKKKVR